MRFIYLIIAVLLFARVSNLVQIAMFEDKETVVLFNDNESEEDKKVEPDAKKIDKQTHDLDYAFVPSYYIQQQKNHIYTGDCMKGHCPLLDQPPELC